MREVHLDVDDSLTEESFGDPVGIGDQITSPDPAPKRVDPIGLHIGARTRFAGGVGPSTLNVVDVHRYWPSSGATSRDASEVIGRVVPDPEGGDPKRLSLSGARQRQEFGRFRERRAAYGTAERAAHGKTCLVQMN